MLGIDIIDLTDPQLKQRNARALDLITNSNDQLVDLPNIFWLLWTAKEAVFKCRREPLVFDPKSIGIKLSVKGDEVFFQSGNFEGKIVQAEDYILAICGDKIDQLAFQIYEQEEENVTNQLRKSINDFFRKNQKNIEIGSDDLNLPILLPTEEPISITHHGRFGAFAYPSLLLAIKA